MKVEHILASVLAYTTVHKAIQSFADQLLDDCVRWDDPRIADVVHEAGRKLNAGLKQHRRGASLRHGEFAQNS